MDEIEQATSTFHKPYSCAQAVYAAFADADENKLTELKSVSGGRNPENTCGALYAALMLAPAEKHEELMEKFAALAGDKKCKIIKSVSKTPCIDCVRIAATLLKEIGVVKK